MAGRDFVCTWKVAESDMALDAHAVLWMIPRGLIGVQDAYKLQEARQLHAPDRCAIIVDLREGVRPDKAARDFLKQPEISASVSAMALVVGNPLSRIVGNFLVGFNRPPFPTQLFTSVEQAHAWLIGAELSAQAAA